MGTHLRVLSESYLMNTNMAGFRWFSKFCVLVLWAKVALALEVLSCTGISLVSTKVWFVIYENEFILSLFIMKMGRIIVLY